MTPVEVRLRRRIALTGPISVAEYMSACLTDPDGYYARREPFGVAGDFVTAPEISQMFGELLGAFLVERWRGDGRPAPFDLVELGPGRGTLMADVLRVAGADPAFAAAARVVLVEASPRLREVQRARLAPLHPRLAWSDRVPSEQPVYLLANEFVDALPVRQFVRRDGRWHERTVGLREGRLAFGLDPVPAPLRETAPEGAVREIRPAAAALASEIAGVLRAHGVGVALIVDYGYETTFDPTLQAVRGHEAASVLDRPGEADLSALVDFPAFAVAARAAGVHAHGPVGQGPFLLSLGLLERAGRLGAGADGAGREQLAAAVDRLAGDGPGQMGALFKVLALTPGAVRLPGFAVVADPAGC